MSRIGGTGRSRDGRIYRYFAVRLHVMPIGILPILAWKRRTCCLLRHTWCATLTCCWILLSLDVLGEGRRARRTRKAELGLRWCC